MTAVDGSGYDDGDECECHECREDRQGRPVALEYEVVDHSEAKTVTIPDRPPYPPARDDDEWLRGESDAAQKISAVGREIKMERLEARLAAGQYPPFENRNDDVKDIRTFDTGATRNLDVFPDIYGFTSPLALGLFAQYMHEHRQQADGTMRDADNWKKGIPMDSYIRSLRRHMQDLTLHHDGYGHLAREDVVSAMAGVMFNIQGYMHEWVKTEDGGQSSAGGEPGRS